MTNFKFWQNSKCYKTQTVTKPQWWQTIKLFIVNCSHFYLFSATQQQQKSLIAMEDNLKHTKGILDPRTPLFSKSDWTLQSSWSLFLPSLTICSCCDTHADSYWMLWVERILWVFHNIPTQIHQIITFSSDKRLTLAIKILKYKFMFIFSFFLYFTKIKLQGNIQSAVHRQAVRIYLKLTALHGRNFWTNHGIQNLTRFELSYSTVKPFRNDSDSNNI